MVKFPETAASDWRIVADAANAEQDLRKKIERGTAIEAAVEKLRVRHEAAAEFQRELDAENTPELEMGTLTEYLANPQAAPADLIEGVVRENGVCIIVGPSGAGKTTMALQLLHSLTTGTDWLGQPVTPVGGGAGVLSYDMDAAMTFDWLAAAPGLPRDQISVVNAHGRGNPLSVPTHREKIVSSWKRLDVQAVLVDSFSASFSGHDQNDTAAVMDHYRDLMQFALTEVGAKALFVIVHSTPSSPKKPRGSTAHLDLPDNRIAIVPDEDDGTRTVSVEKYRDLPGGPSPMTPVVITAPDPLTHLVDLDLGSMALKGFEVPKSVMDLFPETPAPVEEPVTITTSESPEEVDDL